MLLRDFKQSGAAQIGADDETDRVQYVAETDLVIGSVVNVYGRRLRLVRCDQVGAVLEVESRFAAPFVIERV